MRRGGAMRVPMGAGLAALGALLWAGAAAADGGCPSERELAVVERINQERSAAGLPPVAVDVRLVEAAQRHSADMAANGFLSHTGSDGSTPRSRMADAGYEGPGGEAAGFGFATPDSIVDAWMGSTGHRAILFHPDRAHVGVGYAPGEGWARDYWTALLGGASGAAWAPEAACGAAPAACADGLDDDRDGFTDFPDDPGCTGPDDPSERGPHAVCDNGLDEDGDLRVDFPDDPGCAGPWASNEAPACDDGVDNDGDGRVDRADPDCFFPGWVNETGECGFGFELALAVPPAVLWRRRRRR